MFKWFYEFIDWVMSKDTRTGRVSEEEMKKDWAEMEEKVEMDKDKEKK